MLRAEVSRNTNFALILARALPRVRFADVRVTPVAQTGLSRVAIRIQNTGFLRTSGTEQAIKCKAVPPKMTVTACAQGGTMEIVSGPQRIEVSHLEGRHLSSSELLGTQQEGAAARDGFGADQQSVTVEWLVAGSGALTVVASCGRAGKICETVRVQERSSKACL